MILRLMTELRIMLVQNANTLFILSNKVKWQRILITTQICDNFKVIIEPKMSLKEKVQEMVGEQEEIVPHEVIHLKSLIIGYSFQI